MFGSQSTGTSISSTYGNEGVTLKLYVHNAAGKFEMVTNLSLTVHELEEHIAGIMRARRQAADQPLFETEAPYRVTGVRHRKA